MGHGLEKPLIAMKAMARYAAAFAAAATGRTLFRGYLSATAPPIGAAMRPGALPMANVAADSRTESVSTSTSQPTAIRAAHVPNDIRLAPTQRVR